MTERRVPPTEVEKNFVRAAYDLGKGIWEAIMKEEADYDIDGNLLIFEDTDDEQEGSAQPSDQYDGRVKIKEVNTRPRDVEPKSQLYVPPARRVQPTSKVGTTVNIHNKIMNPFLTVFLPETEVENQQESYPLGLSTIPCNVSPIVKMEFVSLEKNSNESMKFAELSCLVPKEKSRPNSPHFEPRVDNRITKPKELIGNILSQDLESKSTTTKEKESFKPRSAVTLPSLMHNRIPEPTVENITDKKKEQNPIGRSINLEPKKAGDVQVPLTHSRLMHNSNRISEPIVENITDKKKEQNSIGRSINLEPKKAGDVQVPLTLSRLMHNSNRISEPIVENITDKKKEQNPIGRSINLEPKKAGDVQVPLTLSRLMHNRISEPIVENITDKKKEQNPIGRSINLEPKKAGDVQVPLTLSRLMHNRISEPIAENITDKKKEQNPIGRSLNLEPKKAGDVQVPLTLSRQSQATLKRGLTFNIDDSASKPCLVECPGRSEIEKEKQSYPRGMGTQVCEDLYLEHLANVRRIALEAKKFEKEDDDW